MDLREEEKLKQLDEKEKETYSKELGKCSQHRLNFIEALCKYQNSSIEKLKEGAIA